MARVSEGSRITHIPLLTRLDVSVTVSMRSSTLSPSQTAMPHLISIQGGDAALAYIPLGHIVPAFGPFGPRLLSLWVG